MNNNTTAQDLNGRTALVTETQRHWQSHTLALARRGARVLVSGRTRRGPIVVAARTAQEDGVADFLQAELNDADSTRKLAQRALEIAGHVGHPDK